MGFKMPLPVGDIENISGRRIEWEKNKQENVQLQNAVMLWSKNYNK